MKKIEKEVDGKLVEKSLEELHIEFMRDAIELKKVTKGLINMFLTGKDTNTAVYLAFKYLNEKNIVAEPIKY